MKRGERRWSSAGCLDWRAVLIACWIFGLSSIAFGVVHLTALRDNAVHAAKWMPMRAEFWMIVTKFASYSQA